MKVKELIAKLHDEDPEADVHFAYPAGDYWRTKLARLIKRVSEREVVWSGYHEEFKLIDGEEEQETKAAVVLS